MALAACGRPAAMGEADSLILVADPELWSQLEQETYDAVETTLFTIRDEKKFYVTYVAPGGKELEQLLLWKQILVFGVPGDPLLEQVADAADRDELNPPEIFQTASVWAMGQAVTVVVLEPGREAESWRALLTELAELLDHQYRLWALNRMWVSGVDTALATQLDERLGILLFGGCVEPFQRLLEVLGHAVPFSVHRTQDGLRGAFPLMCRLLKPANGLPIVLGDTVAIVVRHSEG